MRPRPYGIVLVHLQWFWYPPSLLVGDLSLAGGPRRDRSGKLSTLVSLPVRSRKVPNLTRAGRLFPRLSNSLASSRSECFPRAQSPSVSDIRTHSNVSTTLCWLNEKSEPEEKPFHPGSGDPSTVSTELHPCSAEVTDVP